VADFYLKAVADKGRRPRIVAICYQRMEGGRPVDRLHILLSEEFGEKEILTKMKSLGLFEDDDRFLPIGPDVKGDLAMLATCATHHGIVDLKGENLTRYVDVRTRMAEAKGSKMDMRDRKVSQTMLKEKTSQLVERVTQEAEMFMKNLQKKTKGGKGPSV